MNHDYTVEVDKNLLTVLNDDCIYQILERLSLRDVCSFSRTCKRIQALCENHFRRKYPEQETEVIIGNNDRFKVQSPYDTPRYCVNYFDNFIRDLTIVANERIHTHSIESKLRRVANFVKMKCDQNLQNITIVNHFELLPSFCKEIENFLCNVEVVRFHHRSGSGQDEARFLRYCPNLTKVILGEWINFNIIEAILEQKYQRLTHLYYLDANMLNFNEEKLKIFLQMNEKIKYVAWNFHEYYQNDDPSVECIRTIRTLNYSSNLQQLNIKIDKDLALHFNDICSSLNVLCDRDNFKSLEIHFEEKSGADALKSHASQLAKWKQLTKLNLFQFLISDVMPALRSLVHLKILVMSYNVVEWSFLYEEDILDSNQNLINLPQVEEVQVEYDHWCESGTTFVIQFATHWVNLKRAIVYVADFCFDDKLNVAELNSARKKLKNASELTIFTNNLRGGKNVDHGLVKYKYSEFKYWDFLCYEGQRD